MPFMPQGGHEVIFKRVALYHRKMLFCETFDPAGNAYPEAGKVKLLCFTAAGKTEGETDLRDAGKAV